MAAKCDVCITVVLITDGGEGLHDGWVLQPLFQTRRSNGVVYDTLQI